MKKILLESVTKSASAAKLASILVLFSVLTEVGSDNKVQLKLTGVIDEQLNIVRIDNNGDINIFERPETKYQVISNLDNNVKVTIHTKNGWKLIREGAKDADEAKDGAQENSIDYYVDFKSSTQTVKLDRDKNSTVINKSDFQENCSEFSLIFGAVDASLKARPKAGTYSDTVTVNVTADK